LESRIGEVGNTAIRIGNNIFHFGDIKFILLIYANIEIIHSIKLKYE